jgi:hypothetical protein
VTSPTTIPCDDALATLFLGVPLDEAMRAHVAGCARCREDEHLVRAVTSALAASTVPEPPPGLAAHVLRAAEPLLGRRAAWPTLARALGVALVPLPLILWFNWLLVRSAERVLSSVLPSSLSFYVVLNYSILLALLLALTYGAVPILAERQARGRREESHA